jgi:hypothetical protein
MHISFSSVNDWRNCEQRYAYRYIEGLRPKTEPVAPYLGRILHRYIERLWQFNPKTIKRFKDAHAYAKFGARRDFGKELKTMVQVAHTAGADELAADYEALLPKAMRIADRYWLARGQADLETYEPIAVEKYIIIELAPGLELPVVVDLVTVEPKTGEYRIWEHKTTGGNIPPQTRRLKDLQTLIGATLVEQEMDVPINGVVWNYLRTKEPTIPKRKQDGTMTMRADLDTTWETYVIEAAKAKEDIVYYEDVRERVLRPARASHSPVADALVSGLASVWPPDGTCAP